MFVRFEHRTNVGAHSRHTRSRRLERPWSSLVVGIAESRRVDGRPRQQFVAYVGTIRADEVHVPSAARGFWTRAAERLEQFTPEAREKFEQSIAAKIPRPPADLSLAHQIEAARGRMQAFRAERAAQEEIAS